MKDRNWIIAGLIMTTIIGVHGLYKVVAKQHQIKKEPKFLQFTSPPPMYSIKVDTKIMMQGEEIDGLVFNLGNDEETTVTLTLDTETYEFIMDGHGIKKSFLNGNEFDIDVLLIIPLVQLPPLFLDKATEEKLSKTLTKYNDNVTSLQEQLDFQK